MLFVLTRSETEILNFLEIEYNVSPFTTTYEFSSTTSFLSCCLFDNFLSLDLFKRFFHGMLNENIYLAPSAFEAGFISSAHTDKEINITLKATEKVFSLLES